MEERHRRTTSRGDRLSRGAGDQGARLERLEPDLEPDPISNPADAHLLEVSQVQLEDDIARDVVGLEDGGKMAALERRQERGDL